MSEPVVYCFQHCHIQRWKPDYLETVFEDATKCPAQFDYGPANQILAVMLGYGEGDEAVRQMHLCHEISHTLTSEALGLPYSLTLYHVAHRPFYPDWAAEESLVKSFQKFCNTGEIDPELRGLDKTTDLKALCLKLKDIVAQLQLPQNSQVLPP